MNYLNRAIQNGIDPQAQRVRVHQDGRREVLPNDSTPKQTQSQPAYHMRSELTPEDIEVAARLGLTREQMLASKRGDALPATQRPTSAEQFTSAALLSEEERGVCRTLGLTVDEFIRAKRELASRPVK